MGTSSPALIPSDTSSAAGVQAADLALTGMVALGMMVLFVSPTRLFYVPFTYQGEYLATAPPNLIDLIWLSIGVALYLRAGVPSARPLLAAASLMLVGAIAIATSGTDVPEKVEDLMMFNLRLVGGFMIGALFVRAGFSAAFIASLVVVGSFFVALSTLYLALGGGQTYDFYAEMRRFGGMGLAPNEAGIVFAGSLNMLPFLNDRRPWLGLAAPFLVLGVLMTGSRTAYLLSAAGLVFWIPAIARSVHGPKGSTIWAVLVLLSILGALGGWETIQGLASRDTVAAVGQRLETTTDISTVGRLEVYATTATYLWQHPEVLLMGVGGSNVAVEWFLKDVVPLGTLHTHNLVLQFVTAYGVAGCAVTAAFVLPLTRLKRRFPDIESLGIRWFGLTLVGGQIVQYGLYEVKFLLMLTMTLGFVAEATRK